MRAMIAAALTMLCATNALAGDWGNDGWLKKYPDAKISIGKKQGAEMRQIQLPGGIHIVQEREGENIKTMGVDQSGLGAVLCVKDMVLTTKAMVEACPQSSSHPVLAELDKASEKIDAFIVANSPEPTDMKKLGDDRQARYAQLLRRAKQSSDEKMKQRCESEKWNEEMDKMREHIGQDVSKVLSVPRMPVLNPCM